MSSVKKKVPLGVALIGLMVGLGIGLLLGWNVWPVEYYDTDFPALHPDYKFEYAVMVGAAYQQDGDLERAKDHLALLGKEDVGSWLQDLVHRSIAAGRDPAKIRCLISLAEPLGVKTEIMEPFAGEGGE